DLKNHKRIIRALKICESTGRPYSSFLKKTPKKRGFEIIKIGLQRPREELYRRINERVDEMIKDGLEEEAASLFELREMNALNTVGYREFFDFFEGGISRDKAIELIKRNTRRLARRQMTWWSKDKDIKWFHADDYNSIIDHISLCAQV
ncbi:MAG TPA: tRNA dimethylallyltransferase, partial [Bacteroidales bacterium]|nr:tRNA dimethylallyltransferase [Bacteroidales bacterium]